MSRPAGPPSSGKGALASIVQEYLRYRSLGERTFAQLRDEELSAVPPGGGSSVAVIVWHVAGNLKSRFTDFLTSDGEKPWRHRDSEFEERTVTRAELLEKWRDGWDVLLDALAALGDEHLDGMVTIRGRALSVAEALHRSLAHTAYHVGQIVYVGKAFRGDAWEYLSIPPGGSAAYNRNPDRETGVREDARG